MSRPFSSKLPRKPSPSFPSSSSTATTLNTHRTKKKKNDQNQHQQQQSPRLRNPLQDLNAIATPNTTTDSSSSVSIEAPRGCLRFFLSHSSSAVSSKMDVHGRSLTPKSAPLVRPSKPSISKAKENRNKCNLFMNNSQKPEKPISRKARKNNSNPSSCLYQWQSGKKPRSTTGQQSKNSSVSNSSGVSANELESGSVGNGLVDLKPCANEENFTPLNKIATGFSLDCRAEKSMEENSSKSKSKSKSKTPPIQASVSPEIQCGSSVVSTTTPACYGAGHVVSGITDKRKCRPRGLLAVGENDLGFGKGKALCSSDYGDDDDDEENVKRVFANSDASLVPLPTEASMHWLLSPCSEDDESKKENADDNGSCQSKSLAGSIGLHSPSSPSCSHEFSSDACKTSSSGRKNVPMNPPGGLPEFRELLEPLNHHIPVLSSPHSTHDYEASTLKEGRKFPYDLGGENSPFSMDSLGSGNVILTPGSDSSSDRYADLIRLSADNYKKNKFDSELDSVVEDLQKTNLSPSSLEPIRDSIDFSFQFDSLSTSCSSVYLSRFKQVLDDHASWNSCSTLGNESQSQMRISWREGLMSQIYEMDEFDCCRCLSDEEEDTNGCTNDQLQFSEGSDINTNTSSNQILTESECWSAKILESEPRVEEKGQDNFPSGTPQISYSCAESISTDGGGLLASADSGWDLCYKNELFQLVVLYSSKPPLWTVCGLSCSSEDAPKDSNAWNVAILVAPMCKIADDMFPLLRLRQSLTALAKFPPKTKFVPPKQPTTSLLARISHVNWEKNMSLQVSLPLVILQGEADIVSDLCGWPCMRKLAAQTRSYLTWILISYHSLLDDPSFFFMNKYKKQRCCRSVQYGRVDFYYGCCVEYISGADIKTPGLHPRKTKYNYWET